MILFPTSLKRYAYTHNPGILLTFRHCSPSEFGFKTRPKRLYRVNISLLHLQNVTSEGIQLLSNRAPQSPCVEAYMRIVFPRFSDVSPGVATLRTSGNMARHCQRSSGSFPKMRTNVVLLLPTSGMLMYPPRMFSASKIPVTIL